MLKIYRYYSLFRQHSYGQPSSSIPMDEWLKKFHCRTMRNSTLKYGVYSIHCCHVNLAWILSPGPLSLTWNLIPVWISIYSHSKVCNEMTFSFPEFNGELHKVNYKQRKRSIWKCKSMLKFAAKILNFHHFAPSNPAMLYQYPVIVTEFCGIEFFNLSH